MNLTVKEGGPLPFAYDILTTVFNYGNRAFVKYPKDIPDYFKQSFPEGFSWERNMTYEDGGICIATNDITLVGVWSWCLLMANSTSRVDKICLVLIISYHFDLCSLFFNYRFVGVYFLDLLLQS